MIPARDDPSRPVDGARIAELELDGHRWRIISVPSGDVPTFSSLTPAESDVARRLASGEDYARIASARGASVRTVANQARAVYAKLGVGSRVELARVLGGARLG